MHFIRQGMTMAAAGAALPALAEPGQSAVPLAVGPAGAVGVFEMLGSLVLVVAVILALAWLFRRFQGGIAPGAGGLRVVSSLPLGHRERILVVQVGEEQLLIGAGSAGLRRLHVLAEPLAPEATSAQSFQARLAQVIREKQS